MAKLKDLLNDKVKELILEAARDAIPGEAKMAKVVDKAAEWLADQTKIPVPDKVEEFFYKMVLSALVQAAYDLLKKEGRLG